MTKRQRTKGTSLAKGPVGLLGLALLAYGTTALIFGGHSFTQHAPTGAVHGKTWLGLEVNGWSGLLFIAAGLLLLLGAPMHWGAKGMSLIVGIGLGVVCLIALANGHGALGLFAANGPTELVWGAAAALLLALSLLPRVGARATQRDQHDKPATRRGGPETGTVNRGSTPERTAGVDGPGLPANGARESAPVVGVSRTAAENRDTVAAPHDAPPQIRPGHGNRQGHIRAMPRTAQPKA